MANPLARMVMNNITQRSGKISSSLGNASNAPHIDSKEEQLLKGIVGKSSNSVSASQTLRSLDSLNSSKTKANTSSFKTSDVSKVKSNSINKINLEDLVKGNTNSKNESNTVNKSNTMMTLNELASKVNKNIEEEKIVPKETGYQKNSTANYVRTGVINNLEAYIPKVSLDSIGKKGSLLNR